MSGHLFEFWPDVGPNSGWLGGSGESWERGPYYLDGLLPLAWQLDDERLKAKVTQFVDWTLTHQASSGMIGPASNDDWWPRMVMVKVLAQYLDVTGDPRVVPVLTRYFHYQLQTMPARPLRDWGKYRWQDEALIVLQLYSRTGDLKLLELAALLRQQGFDWTASFAPFRYTEPTTRAVIDTTQEGGNSPAGMQTHGVNNGQALKTAAVQFLETGALSEHANYVHQLGMLDRYHGQPNGMFSCDEHLAGLDPSHGTELCTVVETLFSMETALATFGDAAIADRIEKIAFNALPGTFTDDMWAHQYDQQANQAQSSLNSKPWTTNGPESNLYGLEPHFGCCTANYHQGWPKLTAHLWMRTADDGLAATLYAPCTLNTTVRRTPVRIDVQTDYPFRESIHIAVNPGSTVAFPLLLRVPAWATTATVTINGKSTAGQPQPGSFFTIDRSWNAGDIIDLHFPMTPQMQHGFHESVSLTRGPLVFSLDPGESWVKLRSRGLTADWQVFPQRPWNYALDPQTAPQVVEHTVGPKPFAADNPPVLLLVSGRPLTAWRTEDGVAAPVPVGPQHSTEPAEMLTFIPYGAAKLRITSFPTLAQSAATA